MGADEMVDLTVGIVTAYPIDWPQLSDAIRFGRTGGRCKVCGRPHGQVIGCLDDGTWYDAEARR